MKKIIILLLTCLILTGCNKEENNEIIKNTNLEIEVIKKEDTTLTKSAKLVDSIYNNSNIMLSPLSLDIALAMTANGAENNTLVELETYLNNDINSYNEFLKYYTEESNGLNIANSIWVNSNYTLNNEYQNTLETYYNATSQSLNFKDVDSVDIINNWIEEKTNKKIEKVLYELDPSTSCILINVLDFEQEWDKSFEDFSIRNDIFHGINSKSTQQFLLSENQYIYYENDSAYGFEKNYKNNRYSFIGILPKNEGDFNVTDLNLDSLLESGKLKTVYFELPEFNFECTLDIKENLKSLGLKIPFTDDANFSGILNNTNLKIDSIIQKTTVKVDRNGTKASAATIIGMADTTAMIDKEEAKRVILNRPFLFIIMDNETNIPLFIGKVVNL